MENFTFCAVLFPIDQPENNDTSRNKENAVTDNLQLLTL